MMTQLEMGKEKERKGRGGKIASRVNGRKLGS
jgi:hypothetical protein